MSSATTLAVRPKRASSRSAFGALLLRDLAVLRKEIGMFIGRTVMQPLLLIFVFTYVFPKIGQAVGGARGAAEFSTLLVGGVIASSMIFQGVQAVSLPLVQDFGYTREIEDRVLAPVPVWAVATEKVVSAAIQGVISALIVFPLAAITSAALGLMIGTRVEPRQVPLIFSLLVLPMTFLGCVYYPWTSLTPLPVLKWAVLVNPLVYMSEGLRMSLTTGIPHMPALAIYAGIIGFGIFFMRVGIRGFEKRVLS